jgi:hypothetical protein
VVIIIPPYLSDDPLLTNKMNFILFLVVEGLEPSRSTIKPTDFLFTTIYIVWNEHVKLDSIFILVQSLDRSIRGRILRLDG